MKILKLFGLSFALLGVLFKFFGLPGSSLILILGIFLFTLFSLLFLTRSFKKEKVKALGNILIALLMIYSLFRIQYWNSGPFIIGFRFTFMLVLTGLVVYLIHLVRTPIHWGVKQVAIFSFALGVVILEFTPTYQLYYSMHLTSSFHEKNRAIRYDLWDKYSWFLYNSGKYDEAAEANGAAQKALMTNEYETGNVEADYRLLQDHEQRIREHNWNSLN